MIKTGEEQRQDGRKGEKESSSNCRKRRLTVNGQREELKKRRKRNDKGRGKEGREEGGG